MLPLLAGINWSAKADGLAQRASNAAEKMVLSVFIFLFLWIFYKDTEMKAPKQTKMLFLDMSELK